MEDLGIDGRIILTLSRVTNHNDCILKNPFSASHKTSLTPVQRTRELSLLGQ
jgi:hypothetical protein